MSNIENQTEASAGMKTLDSQPTSETAVKIALSSLYDDKGCFRTVKVREAVNHEKVDAYAEAMKRGEAGEFPPIAVYEVTDRGGERYVSSGLHRCTAARHAELSDIQGYLRRGTWHEALGDAVSTNNKHGHSPTLGDVCETLKQLEQDPEYCNPPQRQIGRTDWGE